MGTDGEHKTSILGESPPDAGAFRFGIEEEYFLVDAETKAIAPTVPEALFATVKTSTLGRGKAEFLQQQVEVTTEPHVDMVKARAELRHLRQAVAAIAAPHGLAILAAGTHPTAVWIEAQQTKGERYDTVMHDLQRIGRRNMLCGLHVHVELPDPNVRVDVMTRMMPYLPIFIALATSSPFWQSERTGLLGYRLAAYDELPRTGVPELFRTSEEYEAYVEALVRAGVMPDASFIWWGVRPSTAHPTLELRAPDCCTRLEDALAIAALYRTLVRRVFFNPWLNSDLTAVSRAIAVENKWQAQRHGIHGNFIDEARSHGVRFGPWLDRVIEEAASDAAALGCLDEVLRCRAIVADGTSADAQLAIYRQWSDKVPSEVRRLRRLANGWRTRRSVAAPEGPLPGLTLFPSNLRTLRSWCPCASSPQTCRHRAWPRQTSLWVGRCRRRSSRHVACETGSSAQAGERPRVKLDVSADVVRVGRDVAAGEWCAQLPSSAREVLGRWETRFASTLGVS